MAGRLLWSPPWRRAPLLLLRAPGRAVAVAGAGAVVAFVAASWPLFLGSVVEASQERQISRRCPWELGVTVTPTAGFTSPANPQRAEQARVFGAAVADVGAATEGLGAPVRTSAAIAELVVAGAPGRTVQLVSRTGATAHLPSLRGEAGGDGVLVPSRTAEELGLGPGTPVVLRAGTPAVDARVGGVYEDLDEPLPPHWCSQRDRFIPQGYGGDPPPPVLLVELAAFERLVEALEVPTEAVWELPVEGELGLEAAASLTARFDGLRERIAERVRGDLRPRPGDAPVRGPVGVRAATSTLPFIVHQSEVVASGLEAGLAPTVGGAATAGCLLLLATGWFWSERRSGDLVVLRRLGVGPAAVGVKAGLELLLPVLSGAVAGLAVAVAVVTAVGPADAPSALTAGRAARWVLGAVSVGLFGAAAVAALHSAVADRGGGAAIAGTRRASARRLAVVPWELSVLGAAVVALRDGARGGLALGEGRLDLDALAFVLPIIVIAATGVLLARLLHLLLRSTRSRGATLAVPLWLGLRRLAARPGAPALFTTCVVTSIGVLVYANGASASLERSLSDKATLAVGSDALLRTVGTGAVPPGLPGASVFRVVEGAQRNEPMVSLLGIDLDSAAGVVRFPGWSDAGARRLLAALGPAEGAEVPAVVVGRGVPDGMTVELARGGAAPFTIDVVGRVDAFPGMSQSRPTIVMSIDRLRSISALGTESIWVRGDPVPVVERLEAAGIDVRSVREPSQALDTATFLAVIWTFGFIRALAVLGATVSAVGLLVYLDARQRSRQLAYGLSRHMGLRRGAHRRSLLVELAVVVVPSGLGGAAAGIAVNRAFVPRLDPLPRFQPPTEALVPWPVLAATAVVAVLLCAFGALIGQRAADRVRLATALRHGG